MPVRHVSRKSMEDMEDDQSEDAGAEQGGKEDDDRPSGTMTVARYLGEAGRSMPSSLRGWGSISPEPAIAVLALAVALAGGPIWLTHCARRLVGVGSVSVSVQLSRGTSSVGHACSPKAMRLELSWWWHWL